MFVQTSTTRPADHGLTETVCLKGRTRTVVALAARHQRPARGPDDWTVKAVVATGKRRYAARSFYR
jgi:hypothetical protein